MRYKMNFDILEDDDWTGQVRDVKDPFDPQASGHDILMLDLDDDELAAMNSENDAMFEDLVGENASQADPMQDDFDQIDPVAGLENIAIGFFEQLSTAFPDAEYHSHRKRERNPISISLVDRTKTAKEDGASTMKTVSFPQNTKRGSSRSTAQVLRIIDLMHEALHEEVPITKRDMYYRDVSLFKTQSIVNKYVDDLAATIGVGRGDLNVRASSKGLFSGAGLTIHLHSGETLYGNDSESTLIPVADDIEKFEMRDGLSWVLIVEKEAVFQTLARLSFSKHPCLPGHGIIITGKGYPDIATRQLVCTLADNLPVIIPMIALVDGDAFGIDIMSVYKFGSSSMSHERETLTAPRLQWAGIFGSELAQFGVERDSMLALTKHDEKKARTLLSRPELPATWRRELQHMIFTRRKAEIEVLANAKPLVNDLGFIRPSSSNNQIVTPPVSLPSPENALTRYLVHKLSVAIAGRAAPTLV